MIFIDFSTLIKYNNFNNILNKSMIGNSTLICFVLASGRMVKGSITKF